LERRGQPLREGEGRCDEKQGGGTNALPVDGVVRRVRIALDPLDERVELAGRDEKLEIGLLVHVAVLGRPPAVHLVI